MQAKLITSSFNSIFHNLALEEYLFTRVTEPTLFLYRNDRNVVIGRHQNPWKECHLDRMESDNVQLCRRKSGGGAVYQDLGNTCFSFIEPFTDKVDYKSRNNHVIIQALAQLGVVAEAKGRNDLLVNDRKISGSAFKIEHRAGMSKALHHGTMLLNVEMDAVARYLNPNKAKLISKGISSVTSRVLNLSDLNSAINHDSFVESISEVFRSKHKSVEKVMLIEMPNEARKIAESYIEWQWRYGECPKFSHELEHRFEWGIVDLHFQVEQGRITKAKIFSDALVPEFIDALNRHLPELKYGREGVKELRQILIDTQPRELGNNIEELCTWLEEAM